MDIKKIKKCHKILDKTGEMAATTLNKFTIIKQHGVEFEVWKAGFCRWQRVVFIMEGIRIYDLRRDEQKGPSGKNLRKEYFKGRLIRTYDGRQNCFVEFCGHFYRFESFPTKEDFEKAGDLLELEQNVVLKYARMYRKMFEKNSKELKGGENNEKGACERRRVDVCGNRSELCRHGSV